MCAKAHQLRCELHATVLGDSFFEKLKRISIVEYVPINLTYSNPFPKYSPSTPDVNPSTYVPFMILHLYLLLLVLDLAEVVVVDIVVVVVVVVSTAMLWDIQHFHAFSCTCALGFYGIFSFSKCLC